MDKFLKDVIKDNKAKLESQLVDANDLLVYKNKESFDHRKESGQGNEEPLKGSTHLNDLGSSDGVEDPKKIT